MPHFLETDIKEQQKYEKRIQTSVDNTVNGQLHEIKFENRVKNKKKFFIKHDISLFLKQKDKFCYSWKSTVLRFLRIQLRRRVFFAEADTKKQRHASAKPSAFTDCRGEFRMLQYDLNLFCYGSSLPNKQERWLSI